MNVMTLAIQLLITSRCRELRLGRAELVRRCGYKNVSKGLRRLEQLYVGKNPTQSALSLAQGMSMAP